MASFMRMTFMLVLYQIEYYSTIQSILFHYFHTYFFLSSCIYELMMPTS